MTFSKTGTDQTASDKPMERCGRGISKATLFVVYASLALEAIASEICPGGCVVLPQVLKVPPGGSFGPNAGQGTDNTLLLCFYRKDQGEHRTVSQ